MAGKTCFLVMPFGVKPSGLEPGKGPQTVDFDRLYQLILEPVLTDLGYEVERADQDVGSLIIKEMIERLAYSDLVVADISIPNGNVYYELGVRHACRDRDCVMVAANWSKQLFDVDQMRRVVYPLADGEIGDCVIADAKAALKDGIPELAAGVSPFFGTIEKHAPVDPEGFEGLEVFRQHTRRVNELLARFHAIQEHAPDEARRAAQTLRDDVEVMGQVPDYIRRNLIAVLRDHAGFDAAFDYIESLEGPLREDRWVEEQRILALGKLGRLESAIGSLEQLIDKHGGSAELWGQLGGRQKDLWRKYRDLGDERMAAKKLSAAISAYEKGTLADLNDFYPSGNLPALLRARGRPADLERARSISALVVEQVERSLELNEQNEWARPTLLGAAFDAGDAEKAEDLANRIEEEGVVVWKLESTLKDLRDRARLAKDPDVTRRLEAVIERLDKMMP